MLKVSVGKGVRGSGAGTGVRCGRASGAGEVLGQEGFWGGMGSGRDSRAVRSPAREGSCMGGGPGVTSKRIV